MFFISFTTALRCVEHDVQLPKTAEISCKLTPPLRSASKNPNNVLPRCSSVVAAALEALGTAARGRGWKSVSAKAG